MSENILHSIDDELQSLLTDLQQDVNADIDQTNEIAAIDTVVSPEPELTDPSVDIEQTEPPDSFIESGSTDISDLSSIVNRFDKDYSEVQTNLKNDRKKIEEVIEILLNRVKNNNEAESDTISLVKALDVLADTNGNAVKLLDSRSKLLSATKSTINSMQTHVSVTGNDVELQNILKQPVGVD
jgi:hypothetical protein